MSMLAARIAKMGEHETLIYPGLIVGISITFQRPGSRAERPPPPFFPPPFGRRLRAVLRPFDGQAEETAKRPQTPINVTWQRLWISITREQFGLTQVGWVAVLRFEQTICSWCGYDTFLPE